MHALSCCCFFLCRCFCRSCCCYLCCCCDCSASDRLAHIRCDLRVANFRQTSAAPTASISALPSPLLCCAPLPCPPPMASAFSTSYARRSRSQSRGNLTKLLWCSQTRSLNGFIITTQWLRLWLRQRRQQQQQQRHRCDRAEEFVHGRVCSFLLIMRVCWA